MGMMSLRTGVRTLLDVLLEPHVLEGVLAWPKFSLASHRIVRALVQQGVSVESVIDVGANVGQFCVAAAKVLTPRKIYAFEPLPSAYSRLRKNTQKLCGVQLEHVALGERKGEVEFYVNAHSHSSSILRLGESHRNAFPNAVETDVIRVPMTTLDRALAGIGVARPCLLKLDVQGYEDRVLEGAHDTLLAVDYIVSELSFKPMYEGERTFTDMLELMSRYGFKFIRPLDFLRDPATQEILQVDGLFERMRPMRNA